MSPRATPVALLLAAFAIGCPIPQAVPEYPKGTSVTPPRIVAETATPGNAQAILRVPAGAGCPADPVFDLAATLVDENTTETVESRWFVNYDKGSDARSASQRSDRIQPPAQADPNAPDTSRAIPVYTFRPLNWRPDVGDLQVVELVVSNGFPPTEPADPLPNRTPLPGFETQVYRWVFLVTNDPCP